MLYPVKADPAEANPTASALLLSRAGIRDFTRPVLSTRFRNFVNFRVVRSTNPNYRCCSSRCHVLTGTKIVGIIELVWIALLLVYAIGSELLYGGKDLSFIWKMVVVAVRYPAIFVMFSGLGRQYGRENVSWLLLPELISQVL